MRPADQTRFSHYSTALSSAKQRLIASRVGVAYTVLTRGRLTGGRSGYLHGVSASVLVCGAVFDGVSEQLGERAEILVRDGVISEIGPFRGPAR